MKFGTFFCENIRLSFASIVNNRLRSVLTGGVFVVPWMWILIGMALCLVVDIGSGYLPARKAASLDPVEALGYE